MSAILGCQEKNRWRWATRLLTGRKHYNIRIDLNCVVKKEDFLLILGTLSTGGTHGRFLYQCFFG